MKYIRITLLPCRNYNWVWEQDIH